MGQRNVSRQLLDLKSEQSHSYLLPNHLVHLGNMVDYPNQNIYPVHSTAGNTTGLNLHQFAGYHGRNVLYGNQHNSIQYYHPLSDFGLDGAAASNFYNPYMSPSSSSRNLSSTNLSLSSEPLQREEPYKHVRAFARPEYQGTNIYPTTEGSYISARSGSSSINLQPEPTLSHHHNYLLQGNYMGQSSQPSSNAWVEQFGNHGRSINSGDVEIVNMGIQEYLDTSFNRNSAFITYHPPLPNLHHQPPVQSMPVSSYRHHCPTPVPSYWHPLNNFHTNDIYPSRDNVDSDSSFPSPFPSISKQINIPSLQEAAQEITHGSFRILSEDAAALQISRFYGLEDITDHHSDMRLDIDDMSYEELLTLEEHIGDVNTGLTEESILKNLKTSVRAPRLTSSQLHQSSQVAPENEACIICQVEYEENERIGTLDCGHSYHADCIKQWLVVKNLCPICKKLALATDKRER